MQKYIWILFVVEFSMGKWLSDQSNEGPTDVMNKKKTTAGKMNEEMKLSASNSTTFILKLHWLGCLSWYRLSLSGRLWNMYCPSRWTLSSWRACLQLLQTPSFTQETTDSKDSHQFSHRFCLHRHVAPRPGCNRSGFIINPTSSVTEKLMSEKRSSLSF